MPAPFFKALVRDVFGKASNADYRENAESYAIDQVVQHIKTQDDFDAVSNEIKNSANKEYLKTLLLN